MGRTSAVRRATPYALTFLQTLASSSVKNTNYVHAARRGLLATPCGGRREREWEERDHGFRKTARYLFCTSTRLLN